MRASLVIFVLVAAACGKVVGDLPVDSGTSAPIADARPGSGDAGSSFPQNSIRRLRTSPPPLNAAVTLAGVVVIGHVTGRQRAEIYVQDMGISGPNSGLRLICGYPTACNLTARDIDTLLPIGQVIDVTGRFDITAPPAPAIPEPQVILGQVTVKPIAPAPIAIEPVPSDLVRHLNATAPEVQSLLSGYVRVEGPFRIANTMPPQFAGFCDATPDGGMPDLFRAVLAEVVGAQNRFLALALGGINYCRSQCGQPCPMEVMNGDSLSSVAGVLIVYPFEGAPELVIRPSRDFDVGH